MRLEDLEKVAGRFRPGRDPFRFGEARTLEAEPTEDEDDEDDEAAAQEAERAAAAQEALRRAMEAQRRQEAAVSGRPVLPDFDLKFLGSFGSRQKRLAVFSDGAEIFNALEGGSLEGSFRDQADRFGIRRRRLPRLSGRTRDPSGGGRVVC